MSKSSRARARRHRRHRFQTLKEAYLHLNACYQTMAYAELQPKIEKLRQGLVIELIDTVETVH